MELLLVALFVGTDQQTHDPQKLSPAYLVGAYTDFPQGLHALATRAVSSGTSPIFSGCNAIVRSLLLLASLVLARFPEQGFSASLPDVILSVQRSHQFANGINDS